MTDPDPLIHKAAEAVADGVAVDWDAAASRVTSSPQQALLQNLRDIGGLAAPPRHTTKASAASAGTPNSPLVDLIAAVATLQVAIALIGFAAGPGDGSEIPAAWQVLLMSVFAMAGLGLMTGGRQDRRAVLLGGFYLAMATSFGQRFIGRIAGPPRPVWASLYLETLGPYFLWRFVQAFPRVERFSRDDRLASLAVPLSLVVGFVLMAINLAVPFAAGGADFQLLEPFTRTRASSNFYWATISALTLAALVVAPFRARSAATAERRRVAWFLLGIGFGAAPLLAELVFEISVPSVASRLTPAMLATVTYPFLASIPVTTAYAVMVERVVEVSFVIRRTLQYALAKTAVVALTIAPLVVLVRLGFQQRDLTIGELLALPIGRLLVAVALFGVVVLLARDRLLARIDRAFRKTTPALEKAVALVTGEIRDAGDVRELADRVEPIVARVLGSSRSTVLAVNAGATAFETPRHDWPSLGADSAVVALMGDEDDAIDLGVDQRGGLIEVLPNADKAWVEAVSCAVVAPLRGRTGDLLGILALRPKDGGLRFTNADLVGIGGVAGPIALVLDQILEKRRQGPDAAGADAPAAECVTCGLVLPASAQACECGGRVRTAALPEVVAGKFKVERRLGAGAMGTAYLASDLALERAVVIKALPRRVAGAARRLEAEARAMARVSDSRLAMIFGIEGWQGVPLLVMEYLAGGTLADQLRRGPLDAAEALTMGCTLAKGLQVLHGHGLLHRDVKPTNIGFTADGAPKLLDFGLASLIADAEDPSRLAGTPLYLAPELIGGAAAGPASDLWSLSIVLHEAIAGRHPFATQTVEGALRTVASANVPDLRTINPGVPPAVADLFLTLLARDPARRPQSAAAMVQELELVLAHMTR